MSVSCATLLNTAAPVPTMVADVFPILDLPVGVVHAVIAALAEDVEAVGAFRSTCSSARTIVAAEATALNLQHADAGELAALLQEFSGGIRGFALQAFRYHAKMLCRRVHCDSTQ